MRCAAAEQKFGKLAIEFLNLQFMAPHKHRYKWLHAAILLFCLLLARNENLYSQRFSNSYDLDQTSNTGITIIPVEDGLLISVGSICGLTTTLESCVGLLKTDFEGNVVWTRIIEGFKTPTGNSMIVEGAYIYMVIQHNENLPNKIKVLKLDMEGNTLQEWDLGETQEYELPFGIIKYRGGFVIYSLLFPSDPSAQQSWILFTDSTMNPSHEVFFEKSDTIYGLVVTKDLKATRDGNLISTQLLKHKAAITKLDSMGNVLWHQRLTHSTGLGDNEQNVRVTELQDGGYAITWLKENPFAGEFYEYPPSIFKLDANGNILWERVFNTLSDDYEIKYTGNLFTAANGDIVGAGNRLFFNEDINRYAVCGWMFRLNPETGEVIWDRTLCDVSRSLRYFHGFTAGSELPNGDLVFTGAYEDTFPNGLPFINDPNVWLVRLGADGCLQEGCGEWTIINPDGSITATEAPVVVGGQFSLYPNPSKGQVWVVASGEGVSGQCQIVLYDAQGRPLKKERFQPAWPQSFDWSGLPPGMYYYHITAEGASPQSGKLVIGK